MGLEMKEPNIRALVHGGKGQGERMCNEGSTACCNGRSVTSKSGFKACIYMPCSCVTLDKFFTFLGLPL